MGLDMYLSKKTHVGGKWEHNKVEGVIDIKTAMQHIEIDPKTVSDIVQEVGYWRKANQIHKWFVDNVQDGDDNCQEYYVSYEQLQELKTLCEKVLETKDASLLPPQSGFFFGSTEIDEYYFEDLKDTIKILSSLDDSSDYYYSSSW